MNLINNKLINLIDFKTYFFQKELLKYNDIVNKLENHILYLYKSNIISVSERNIRLSNIYEIIKLINTVNDDFMDEIINESFNTNYETSEIDFDKVVNLLVENYHIYTTNDIYQSMYNYYIKLFNIPKKYRMGILDDEINKLSISLNYDIIVIFKIVNKNLQNLIGQIGFTNLSDIVKIFELDTYNLDENEIKLYDFYNELIIVYGVSVCDCYMISKEDKEIIRSNSEFFTEKLYFKNDDSGLVELLDNCFILYFKCGNIWLICNCFFKVDPLQINYRLMRHPLYEKVVAKKSKLEKTLSNDVEFKKKYLKYCSLFELIVMSSHKLLKMIETKYNKYNEINNKTFQNILKDINSKTSDLLNWYDTIKLLLFGSDDNINTAGTIFLLLKDKKTNINMITDIIYDNLIFCNQMKLKKTNQNIRTEMNKLNDLTFDRNDLKKELASNPNIPTYVKALAMEKFNDMKSNSNEYHKQYTFIKTIINFPWTSPTDNNIYEELSRSKGKAQKFIKDAEIIMDKTTYGHKNVKNQMSLLITKWISNPNSTGSAIGLVGPPGVGKTLIAKSLAKVLGIPMILITLGGQNDAELLVGHGYTYSGSQPGLIIKKMCDAGKSRCIMFFDELDKCCAKHGSINEITSILIHLTDPNTNKSFQDRFLQGIDFPLDKVIFVASYNDSSKVDPILLDRMIELEVKPYNIEDKINILNNYIIPELKENIGIAEDKEILINNDDIKKFIYEYTAEAGVRDLKHKIEQVLLNINKRELFSDKESSKIELTYQILESYMEEQMKIHRKMIPSINKIGYINGLYATINGGGGITSIEIVPIITGKDFELKLTGSMGDVMKESIFVAYNSACQYINENNELFGINILNDYIKSEFPFGFHIHTPEGATPKDGPSAGTAFTVGFVSAIMKIPVNRVVAMTGEINLSKEVTKIGGLEYKLMGAKFAGVKIVLIPKQNEVDLEIIKKNNITLFSNDFKYIIINNLDDAIKNTLLL
jgi:endopeptidase La